ncbi:MAG: septum formation protein Maf [Clostridia bacterium]|nr:septum formation protein Maf [Clostridia bacterium]
MIKLYLASASPRRKEILETMKLDFTVATAEADESLPSGTSPENAGEILAARKALALKERLIAEGKFDADTAIIAADTLVYCDGERLGKPHDAEDAKRMLMTLCGKVHSVCTGTCVISGARSVSTSEVSNVYMRHFSKEEAASYVATGEPLDKAGAYGIQGIGSVLIDRIDGDFFSVMGMSPKTVYKLMNSLGIPYFQLINQEK